MSDQVLKTQGQAQAIYNESIKTNPLKPNTSMTISGRAVPYHEYKAADSSITPAFGGKV